MANLRVIAEIKPAGDFPVVDAPNVSVTGGKRLDVALSEAAAEVAKKANKSEVDTALASKANKSEVDAALAGKANKSEVDAAIENKADKSALEATNASVSANTSNIQGLSTESAALSARMDEFTKLKEGSTTGDAELADGRVGADGKTYDNIGGAIRGQVTDLKSDLVELKEDITFNYDFDVSYGYESGYINTSGDIGSTVDLTPDSNASFFYSIVNVEAGDKIAFKGTGGGSPRLWAFLDENNKLLSHANASTTEETIKTAQVKGKFIYNTNASVADTYVKKAYSTLTNDKKTESFIESQNTTYSLNYISNIEKETVLLTGIQNIGDTVDMRLRYRSFGFGTVVVPCKYTDYFKLRIAQPMGYTNFRLWAFVDSSYHVISRANGSLHDVMALGETIKAPTNSAYLICNISNDTTGMSIVKYSQNPELSKIVNYSQIINNPYQTVDYTDAIRVGWNLYLGVNAGTVIDAPYGNGTSRFSTAEIECVEGDIFELKSVTGDAYPMWAWVDSERKLLSRSSGNWYDNDSVDHPIRLTAPANAAKLLCVFDFALCPDSYVIKIGERVNIPNNLIKYDATNARYLFPTYSGTPDIVEIPFEQSKIYYNFEQFYELFHGLITENVLEEINMSTNYLANVTDSIPSDITNITNGGMYMYHLIPPQNDGSDVTIKHKRIKMMIVSGLHGSETNSIWNLYYLLKNIVDGTFKRQYNLVSQFVDLYVIPLACPDGIQNHTRTKTNGINLNRDFAVRHWGKVEDSDDEPNSQYETRCISWWLEQLEPDCLIDHHTSAGDNVSEGANLLSWGDSEIMAIASVIDEAILDSMAVAKNYAPVLEPYTQMFGHAQCLSAYSRRYGMLEKYACQNGIIGATYEVVEGLTWYGERIFDYTTEDETKIMTLDHFNFMNFLMKFLSTVRDIKNGNIDW